MRSNTKKFVILFAVYMLFVFSPFIFPQLNQIAPYFLGMPLTMWYTHLVIIAGCVLVFYASRHWWVSFDDCDDEGVKKEVNNE